MILVAKKPEKFEYGRCIEDFNALAILQFFEHGIDDIQTASNEDVILNEKLCAFHILATKKTSSKLRHCAEFRDVMVS